MIFQIVKKEWSEILREGRFRIALGIALALLLVSVAISRNHYAYVQAQHQEAKENARNIWVSQDEKNPHSAAHYGTYAFKPKYPLSLIDQGVDKYAGISIFLEAHKRNEAQYMAAADQTGLARFGELTPDFILLFILPLLAILIAYDSFTREREGGTLQLLKSQGLPGWKLALGKWGGVSLPIYALAGGLFLVAAVLLGALQDFGEFEPGHLLLLFAVYAAYFAIFINLALIVSALSPTSGISLVASLAIWMLSCLAAPKAASNLADALHPYPTRQEFAEQIAEDRKSGLDGHNPWNKEAQLLQQQLLAEYGVDSVQQLPFNFDGYIMQKGEEHEAEIYYKHYALLKDQHEAQTRVYRAAALASPFLPARFLSMAIARTDYQTHWDFAHAAEAYRVEMQNALNSDFAQNSTYGDWEYLADKSLWSSIPDFSYEPAEMGAVLNRNASNLLVLLLWLCGSFAGLFFVSRNL